MLRLVRVVCFAILCWAMPAFAQEAPERGYSYEGNDFLDFAVGKHDWQACSKACDLNGACKAWSLYSPDGTDYSSCWLKNKVGELKPEPYSDSGLKTAQAPVPAPGKIEKGKAFNGRVIFDASYGYDDTASCKALCETNRQCVAWSLFNPEKKKGYLAKCHLFGYAGEQVAFKTAYSAWRESPVLEDVAAPAGDEMLRWRSLEEVVAEFGPQIAPRKLTGAERGEIPALELAILQGGSFEYFRKLHALALTGDRAAMKALVNVLLEIGLNRQWPADFPYKVRAAQSFGERSIGPTPLDKAAARALAGRWAVSFWQMHGGDPRAALALSQCSNSDNGRLYQYDCGFKVTYAGKDNAQTLNKYVFGDTKKPPQLTVATYEPASTVEMEQYRFAVDRAKYEQLVKSRRNGTKLFDWDAEWLTRYAAAMGLTDAMNASIAEGEAVRMQIAAQDAERRRRDLQARWDDLYRRHGSGGLSADDTASMEYIAATFGDEKLLWFSDTYGLSSQYALGRLCAVDTATARCQNQTDAINRKQADAAALAAAVAEYNAGVDAARRAGLQSSLNLVEVRTYDANGNYTGTTMMSQTQAEIVGARPQ